MLTEPARLALCLVGVGGCVQQVLDITNFTCAHGECLGGYVCHPETNLCVPEIVVGCAGTDTVCPSDVTGGTACKAKGAFIPCRDSGPMDCSDGCRTCVNGVWSDCSVQCTLGEVTSCSTCSDDCTESVLNAAPVCDTKGTANVCAYDLSAGCQGTYVNADADASNGCECLPSGTEIACNDIDEDCDGADLQEESSLQHCGACGNSCERLPHVKTPGCVGTSGSYACTIVACDAGWTNQDTHVANGCETACIATHGSIETCDGIDNDCNGLTDDGITDLQSDCNARVTNSHVATWTCVGGACSVATCETNHWDIDELGSSGCEYACRRSNSGVETCDDVDNDCDDVVDNVTDILADCRAQLSHPADVTAFVCDERACRDGHCCRIWDCVTGKHDADQDPHNGCELECTVTGEERCDGTDNDCNGVVDDALQGAVGCLDWFLDTDDDGYGVDGESQCWCQPTGLYRASQGGDCADGDPLSNPGAREICDGNDNDCSGAPNPDEADDDGDRYVECSGWSDLQEDNTDILGGNDCADHDPDIRPGATEMAGDAVDQDCDGEEICYLDSDNDGYRPDDTSTAASSDPDCSDDGEALATQPTGDCADEDPSRHPGQTEVCNNADDDCNGIIDDGVAHCACAGNGGPAASETCGNGIDDDCNAAIEDGCRILPSNLGAVDPCQNSEALVMDGGTIDTTDGAITGVASPVSILVAQANARSIRVFFFDSVTIDGTVTVSGGNALALVACKDLTVNGELNLCGTRRHAGPGGDHGGDADARGSGPGAGTAGVGWKEWPHNRGGGGGGSHCGAGGAGGSAGSGRNLALGGEGGKAGVGSATLIPLTGGSGGGGGVLFNNGKWGGGGGGAVQLVGNVITIAGTINACGSGGGGPASDGDSGGGAGAGGGILLEGTIVTLAGGAVLAANGGGGGGGDDRGEVLPHIVNVDTTGEAGPAGEARAQGGQQSPGINPGFAGAGGAGGALTGTEINGSPGKGRDQGDSFAAGGGGGGAGYIRINSVIAPDMDAGAAISPRDSACLSRGSISFQ
jgi:hypothetical protein